MNLVYSRLHSGGGPCVAMFLMVRPLAMTSRNAPNILVNAPLARRTRVREYILEISWFPTDEEIATSVSWIWWSEQSQLDISSFSPVLVSQKFNHALVRVNGVGLKVADRNAACVREDT